MRRRFTLVLAALAFTLVGTARLGRAANILGCCDTGEIYVSSDSGETWAARGLMPIRDAVALSALTSPERLLLLSRSGSVYLSEDGGERWTAVGVITATDVVDLAVQPGGRIFALTASGSAYVSTNEGSSFEPVGSIAASQCVSLAVGTDGSLYALIRTGEIFMSSDSGTTWAAQWSLPLSDTIRLRRRQDTLVLMTESGDIGLLSRVTGDWDFPATLSQVGMSGLVTVDGTIYAASREGHIARSGNATGWNWVGSINQLRLTALASDQPALADVEGPVREPGRLVGAVWPNPASGAWIHVPIQTDRPGLFTVTLLDAAGRRAHTRTERFGPGSESLVLPTADLPGGIYWLRVTTEGQDVGCRKVTVVR